MKHEYEHIKLKYLVRFSYNGVHRVKFYHKGNIRVLISNQKDYINSNGQTNQINSIDYEYIEIPFYVDNINELMKVELFPSGDAYLHKQRIE